MIQRRSASVLALCIAVAAAYAGVAPLPDALTRDAQACIDMIYKENFKQAEAEAKKIIKNFPDHPAGYFFYAATIDAWMAWYQSTSKEELFYQYCDKAIEKGEGLLDKDRNDFWAKFFVGGADGYKGTYESRQGRWITAFRYGWKGASTLMELAEKKPGIADLDFGIGCYEYWRSAMAKALLMIVDDKRQSGIDRLYKARKEGLFTRLSSAVNLIDILTNEKRYDEAMTVIEDAQKIYPNSLIFRWGKAKIYFEKKQWHEAELEYQYLLSRVESESYDNHYNAVLCHLNLAKIYMQTKQFTQAIAECNRIGYYSLSEEVRKQLDSALKESASLKDQALNAKAKG
jgi:tetratricopeptide (TPR) repeat protein